MPTESSTPYVALDAAEIPSRRAYPPLIALICAIGALAATLRAVVVVAEQFADLHPPQVLPYVAPTIVRSAGGVLDYTLRVDSGVWRLPHNISFRTRLYNGLAPSPVLWASPGDRVRLTVVNALGADAPTTASIGYREANTTNLHLHGIRDSVEHDDTFARVRPGEQKVYDFRLDATSGTTLMLYHPHADGSTSLQSFGGMGGALVVEDAAQEDALSLPVVASRVALLQVLNFDPTAPDYVVAMLQNGDTSAMDCAVHNPSGFSGALLVVNGGDALDEVVPLGGWLRLKLVNAVTATHMGGSVELGFSPTAPCTVAALALDGVWLTAPRKQRTVVVPPGGRAELAVGCAAGGTHVFGTVESAYGGAVEGGHAVALLRVPHCATCGGHPASMTPLPHTLPGPPKYYSDLRGVGVRHSEAITFSTPDGGNVVNRRPYDRRRVDFRLHLGAVAEWRLRSAEAPATPLKLHPFHQHVTHFQVVNVTATGEAGGADGLARVGDWRDTIPLYGNVAYVVRFVSPFAGLMMVHCHIQKHSEYGMMALAEVAG